MSTPVQAPEKDLPRTVADARRRGFLGLAAAGVAGVLIAPGIRLIEVAQAATGSAATGTAASSGVNPKVRWGMLIDTNLCAKGCDACVRACQSENGWSAPTSATSVQWIRKIEIRAQHGGRESSVPMMCQHCAEPPCVDVCPTGASFKRADGIVLVDKHICIGCRYCVMACPYKARSFVHEPQTGQKPDVPRGMGTVEGCTLCVHRIDQGGTPACVQACAAEAKGAIVFGDLNDPNSDIARRIASVATRQVREDLRLNTGVRYAGL